MDEARASRAYAEETVAAKAKLRHSLKLRQSLRPLLRPGPPAAPLGAAEMAAGEAEAVAAELARGRGRAAR